MNELWVARDGDHVLGLFHGTHPVWDSLGYWIGDTSMCFHVTDRIPPSLFSDLLPGQCRRLVMESEASE